MHREFVPPGQTVNHEFYLAVLRRLRENLRRKRPELWRSGDWFLHHNNAPAHTALSMTRYLPSLRWTVVPHPPYSPDLAPCDFFLFLTMKKHSKERDLPPWRRWKQLHRRHSTTSSFSSSRDASHSGKKDRTSELPPMESISKRIKCFFVQNVNKSFLKTIRVSESPLIQGSARSLYSVQENASSNMGVFLSSVGKCRIAKVNELISSFLLNQRNPLQKLFNYWLRLTVKIACLMHACLNDTVFGRQRKLERW